ncbi:MAG: hypothetical protein WHS89_11325 [Acidimicrobiales bacterium]
MRVRITRWRRAAVALAMALAPAAALAPATVASAASANPKLYVWGNNAFGQFGNGRMGFAGGDPTGFDAELSSPTRVPGSASWADISSGVSHSVAIRKGGTMWAWGFNPFGLGVVDSWGNQVRVSQYPVKLPGGNSWADVETTETYTLALRKDGSLWAWGDNTHGQLGLGDTEPRAVPTRVGTDTNWRRVVVTPSGTSFALKDDGSLWAWGNNRSGALALGSTSPEPPALIDSDPHPTPVQIPGSWSAVAAGGRRSTHVLAITADGRLFAWGQNCRGQLGLGTAPVDGTDWHCLDDPRPTPVQVGSKSDWVTVVAGSTPIDGGFSLAIDSSGTLYAWGDNIAGQLGLGTSLADGDGLRSEPAVVTGGSWSTVSAGYGFTLAIRSDETLWSWGWNPTGQLGNGNPGPGLSSIESWLVDTSARQTSPQQVGTMSGWASVSAGGLHAMATR